MGTSTSVILPSGIMSVAFTLVFLGLGALGRFYATKKRENREDRHEDRAERTERAAGTASFISGQQAALDAERAENARLHRRIDAQDKRIAELNVQLIQERQERTDQRAYYETELEKVRDQLSEMTEKVADLARQLHPEGEV